MPVSALSLLLLLLLETEFPLLLLLLLPWLLLGLVSQNCCPLAGKSFLVAGWASAGDSQQLLILLLLLLLLLLSSWVMLGLAYPLLLLLPLLLTQNQCPPVSRAS
jgi:hypothetical protein